MEPFYVRQNAELINAEDRTGWFAICTAEAKAEGAKLCRYSVSEDGRVALVEGWNALAHEVGDQGDPRFMYTDQKQE